MRSIRPVYYRRGSVARVGGAGGDELAERLAPAAGPVLLAVLQWARGVGDDEVLGGGGQVGAETAEQLLLSPGGVVERGDEFRVVHAGVEGNGVRLRRQLDGVEPLVQADGGV